MAANEHTRDKDGKVHKTNHYDGLSDYIKKSIRNRGILSTFYGDFAISNASYVFNKVVLFGMYDYYLNTFTKRRKRSWPKDIGAAYVCSYTALVLANPINYLRFRFNRNKDYWQLRGGLIECIRHLI